MSCSNSHCSSSQTSWIIFKYYIKSICYKIKCYRIIYTISCSAQLPFHCIFDLLLAMLKSIYQLAIILLKHISLSAQIAATISEANCRRNCKHRYAFGYYTHLGKTYLCVCMLGVLVCIKASLEPNSLTHRQQKTHKARNNKV